MKSAAWIVVCFCISLTPRALAQYTTASLAGSVADASGGVLPDAQVTVRNTDTGFVQSATTDAAGAFLFSRLPVGNYELRVEKAGFTAYVQSGITLAVNQVANQTVTMQVGQVSEKVSVEANAELVATRTATTGQLVNQRLVVDLPLNGRGAQSLVFIAPGTVNLSGRYCGVDCHGGVYPGEQVAGVNGAGSAQVNYQMDGTDHNDTYINMNLPFPNPDALQEFNLQSSNFTAEYGNAGGGIGLQAAAGDPERQRARQYRQRQPRAGAECLDQSYLYAFADPAVRQHLRPGSPARRLSVQRPVRLSRCRREDRRSEPAGAEFVGIGKSQHRDKPYRRLRSQ
jgi:hypothetical protein